MRKILRVLPGFLIAVFLCVPAFAQSPNCIICHSSIKARIKDPKGIVVDIYIDADRFSKSVHGNLDCTTCHIRFSDNPHMQPNLPVNKEILTLASEVEPKAKIEPVALAACYQCHGQIYDALKDSIHGKNIFVQKQTDGPLCLDCHGSPHYIMPKEDRTSPVNHWNILNTCGKCHNREDISKKYGLSTEVIERYKESFHGKKYILGYSNAPICTDCHGAHDIKNWDDPDSPVSWGHRVATCGKCHKGANKKFVAAITHKPVGKDNPVAYYGEKLLILLLLSVFAFTIGHVILEAYSEIRDNIFRKGKEEHHEK